MTASLDVLAGYAQDTGAFRVSNKGATELATACIAVAELIAELHARRMEIGRRGGNTSGSPHREEWEFLGAALAHIAR